MSAFIVSLLLSPMIAPAVAQDPIGRQESDSGTRHSFVISGAKTAIKMMTTITARAATAMRLSA